MPNIASLLKEEIARVARKEVRAETSSMKKAVSQYRSDIAALKRQVRELEQQSRKLRRVTSKVAAVSAEPTEKKLRFSAKGFAEARRRLDLSAAAVGLLIGATGQSVYKWEQGKARPRVKHLAKIAELRTMGKREATARLEALAG
ncbi:helix-turn-helix transcriptional regulator [Caenimonas koreensis]|uniref:helix-turn-helix transcriptional regulator n=1 Tax=Caenimonas koreensis TaxID=367474 RepID=UPI0037834D89